MGFCARETLVFVACRPIFVFQAKGLIAVRQRLAPMSKARTNFEERETLVIFPWWGRFLVQHVMWSLGRPQWPLQNARPNTQIRCWTDIVQCLLESRLS